MVVFEGSFDAVKFEECLRYVRDSMDWLLARGEVDKTLLMFPPDLLTRATETCKIVLLQLANLSNTRITINRLPSEIFSHILLFLKDHGTPLPRLDTGSPRCHDLPALGSWSQASLVCRHWRQEVLGTPGLWTIVRISDDLEAVNRWTTTWLSRSGALPLTVMFNTYLTDHHDNQLGIVRLTATRRISKLCFYQIIPDRHLRSILMQVADHLEVLFLIDIFGAIGNHPNFDEPLCKLRRLRVLSMAQVQGPELRVWSTGELRHLSLGCLVWDYVDLRGFLAVLRANIRLEELMIHGLRIPRDDERWNISTAFPEHHWPIRMPKLKRLFTHEGDCEPLEYHPIEDILDQSLSLPPTCVRFHIASCLDVNSDCGKTFPFERMAVSSFYVVGTDGISACVLRLYRANRGAPLPLCINSAQVRELWLEMQPGLRRGDNYNYHLDDALPTHNATIWDMNHLVKLVVQPYRSLSFLLQRLENRLPTLKELHILMQYHDDRQAILHFLTQRRQNGLQLNTLRFTGDPTAGTSEAFDSWKENSQEFQSQVDQVVFEEVCIPDTGLRFDELVSAGFGLPEACKHSSPTSQLWRPWNTYVTFD